MSRLPGSVMKKVAVATSDAITSVLRRVNALSVDEQQQQQQQQQQQPPPKQQQQQQQQQQASAVHTTTTIEHQNTLQHRVPVQARAPNTVFDRVLVFSSARLTTPSSSTVENSDSIQSRDCSKNKGSENSIQSTCTISENNVSRLDIYSNTAQEDSDSDDSFHSVNSCMTVVSQQQQQQQSPNMPDSVSHMERSVGHNEGGNDELATNWPSNFAIDSTAIDSTANGSTSSTSATSTLTNTTTMPASLIDSQIKNQHNSNNHGRISVRAGLREKLANNSNTASANGSVGGNLNGSSTNGNSSTIAKPDALSASLDQLVVDGTGDDDQSTTTTTTTTRGTDQGLPSFGGGSPATVVPMCSSVMPVDPAALAERMLHIKFTNAALDMVCCFCVYHATYTVCCHDVQ